MTLSNYESFRRVIFRSAVINCSLNKNWEWLIYLFYLNRYRSSQAFRWASSRSELKSRPRRVLEVNIGSLQFEQGSLNWIFLYNWLVFSKNSRHSASNLRSIKALDHLGKLTKLIRSSEISGFFLWAFVSLGVFEGEKWKPVFAKTATTGFLFLLAERLVI